MAESFLLAVAEQTLDAGVTAENTVRIKVGGHVNFAFMQSALYAEDGSMLAVIMFSNSSNLQSSSKHLMQDADHMQPVS